MSDNKNIIVIVLVLYKMKLEESVSYQSFVRHIKHLKQKHHLIIFNNSSEIEIPHSESYTSFTNLENSKLVEAYNFAFDFAKKNSAKWLLLLDQDTNITAEYFQTLSYTLDKEKIGGKQNVAAVVPFLTKNNKIISPHQLLFFNNITRKIKHPGFFNHHIIALNTLSLLKIDFLDQINGFSNKYPLDMLDYWVYSQIFKHKKSVYLMECRVEHDLSVLDYDKNLSLARYKSILDAEKQWFKELNLASLLLYRFRLLLRSCKQSIFIKNKKFALLSLKHVFK